jgi:hypothetical protein
MGIAAAGAQSVGLNAQPFSFGSATGGLGISPPGKQAIFSEKLFGLRPEHMLRGPGGAFLVVGRGPSGIAVAYDASGQPVFSGRRIWGGSSAVLNQQSLFFVDPSQSSESTSATLSTWTAMTDPSGEFTFANLLLPYDVNPIDVWTWEVYALSEY